MGAKKAIITESGDGAPSEPKLEGTNITTQSDSSQSTLNVTSILDELNEDSYIRKVERKDVSQFQGHGNQWFEKAPSDMTDLEDNIQCDVPQLKENEENKANSEPVLENQSDKVNMA